MRERERCAKGALAALLAVSSIAALQCGGSSKPPVGTYLGAASAPRDAGAPRAPRVKSGSLAIPKALPSHVAAVVPEKSLGPFLARRADHALAVYVAPTDPTARQLVAVPLGAHGEAHGQARVVAAAPGETNALIVRPTGGDAPGFVAAITALSEKGEALSVVGIGDDGTPRGAPIEVAHGADDIVWTEILPTPRGAICLWTVETKDGSANVLGVPLDGSGKPRGMPSYVARSVLGWQALTTLRGPAVAVVTGPVRAQTGALSLLLLDNEGRALGAPLAVTTSSTVGADFDAVARTANDGSPAEITFAWTDRSGLDPELAMATVDATFVAHPIVHPLPPLGGSAFVGLASGKAGTLVAWDEPGKRGHARRRVHLARIAKESVEAGPTLEVQGDGAPEMSATEDGFAVLARARACIVGESEPSCMRTPPMPTLMRLDGKLAPASVEALRLPDLSPSSVAWGLECSVAPCLMLASPQEVPTPAFVIEAAARPSAYRLPSAGVPDPNAPHGLAMTTLATGEPYAQLSVAKIHDDASTSLLALLTSAVDDPNVARRGPGSGAKITVRALDGAGHSAHEEIITTRALSVGGVALAAADKLDDGAAIAWVAREAGDPQVHLTRLDRHGKKLRDVLVTTQKGDASDVALSAVPGGWLVAWVDGRDGNGEVYTSRVSNDLHVAPHERITKAPGDASDLTMLVRGDVAWLAWADPRENPSDQFADVFVARVRTSDAKKIGDETRVLATAAHSRSPVLAKTSNGVAVAWIEEAAAGDDAASSAAQGAMVAWLDENQRPLREPIRLLGAAEGVPTAITLAPSPNQPDALRAVLVRATREELVLDAVDLAPSASAPPRGALLTALLGPPTLDVSLELEGDALYFADGGPEPGDNRARRLTLVWK